MIRSLNERRRTKENLVNKDWQIGEEEEAGLENKIDVRCTILLHAEAIDDEIRSEEEPEQCKRGFRVLLFRKGLF